MQRDAKHWFRIIIGLLLFLFIALYAFYQFRKIIEGPQITITEPRNGATVVDSLITINGQTRNINYISMDDGPIFIDESGNFKQKLLLYPGYNIIKFEGRDKFGKDKVVNLELNYKENI